LWALLGGIPGLLGFVQGRLIAPRDDETHEVGAAVDVPVEVRVGRDWHAGRLTRFRQDEQVWRGYVVPADPALPPGWFERDRVRPGPEEE
jgi:hypothetical protein